MNTLPESSSGMDAGTPPPPKQETKPPIRHIPPEILEQILLSLPVKSLVRFRHVSKSWKSMISEPDFVAKHRSRAIKRVVINDNPVNFHIQTAFSSPLSSISSNHPIVDDATNHIFCPFRAGNVKLKAFCDELWCVAMKKSLYIWNPSMGTYRKLPDAPRLRSDSRYWASDPYVEAVYGLGYDAITDDYKLLKVWRISSYKQGTLLYSLRSDSWRQIYCTYFPGASFPGSNGAFVNGAFHWMVINRGYGFNPPLIPAIISFDLSTEKYKEVPQPEYFPEPNYREDSVELTVLRGMLCVFLKYKIRQRYSDAAFVLWVMKDYGVEESWTKMYEISYKSIFSTMPKIRITEKSFTLRPLYLYESGEVLIWVCSGFKDWDMVVYRHRKVVAHKEIVPPGTKVVPVAPTAKDYWRPVAGGGRSMVRAGFVYVESLISPAVWPPAVGQ